MKTPAILLSLALAAVPALADQADQYYRLGMSAIQQGKPEAAEAAFKKALKIRPNHAQARYQLGQLPTQADAIKAKRRASDLAQIQLPSIDFREVTVNEALTALNKMVEEESAKKNGEDKALVPNFMVQDPKGELGDKEVTLRLKNVPAKTALDYLLQQVGATVRYDEHATVVRPASAK